MEEVLLDCCQYQSGVAIFAVNHLSTNEISVIVPNYDYYFSYIGFTKNCFDIPIGGKVEVTDDEGEVHEITRLT